MNGFLTGSQEAVQVFAAQKSGMKGISDDLSGKLPVSFANGEVARVPSISRRVARALL